MTSLHRVDGLSLRDKELIHREEACVGAAAPLHRNMRVVDASYQDAFSAFGSGGYPGMSIWWKTPQQTQNALEILYSLSGLGMPLDPLGGAGKHCRPEGQLNWLAEPR